MFLHQNNQLSSSMTNVAWFHNGQLRFSLRSDDNLRGTPRCSLKKPNLGRLLTGGQMTTDVNSHMPCRAVTLRMFFQNGMVGARQWRGMGMAWHGMACVNQTTAALWNSNGKDIT